jgi:cytoskeletal protein RodZ
MSGGLGGGAPDVKGGEAGGLFCAGGAAAGGFGRWLLQERELRGLDRDEVARLTKLGPSVISALESGDPGRMPPKAYVFGYLRSYAAVVGLDADDVVLRWQEVVGPEEPAKAGRAGAGRRSQQPPPWRTALVVAVAIAALALVVATLAGPRRREPLKLERPRAVERGPYEPAPPEPGR